MVSVGIIGASGYTGAELLRLGAQHPDFDIVYATGDSQAGTLASTLYPSLSASYPNLVFQEFDPARAEGLDLVFLGLPHEASLQMVAALRGKVGCIVDLSAAFRLKDASLYPRWYGFEHEQPELLAEAVYGLPELYRDELKGATLIATPGCYVTAASLALAPLVRQEFIQSERRDRRRGVRGVGRRSGPQAEQRVLHRGRGLLRLRTPRPSPHPGDRAGDGGAGALHAPPRADESRHPRHLLRPADRSPSPRSRCSKGSPASTSWNRSSSCGRRPLRRRRPSVRTRSTSPPATTSEPATCSCCARSTTSPRARPAGPMQAANVALGLPETAGLSAVGMFP